jgi:type 1 glutamine amidotransferase
MKIQVHAGDRFHATQVARDGLAPLAAQGRFDLKWEADPASWPSTGLANGSAVLLTKSNVLSATDWRPWVTDKNEAALRDYVRAGGGLLVVHSGCAGYGAIEPMRSLMGGHFTQHPPPCEVRLEPVPGHPLGAGVGPAFTVHDEHYFVELADLNVAVFLHSHSGHGMQPAGWVREEGRGRVCVLTPGHTLPVWRHPSFQTLLANALRWVTAAR